MEETKGLSKKFSYYKQFFSIKRLTMNTKLNHMKLIKINHFSPAKNCNFI